MPNQNQNQQQQQQQEEETTPLNGLKIHKTREEFLKYLSYCDCEDVGRKYTGYIKREKNFEEEPIYKYPILSQYLGKHMETCNLFMVWDQDDKKTLLDFLKN